TIISGYISHPGPGLACINSTVFLSSISRFMRSATCPPRRAHPIPALGQLNYTSKMTRRRWIADEVLGNRAALTGDHARHLSQVLRAQVGQQFDLSTGAIVRSATITSVRPDRVEF